MEGETRGREEVNNKMGRSRAIFERSGDCQLFSGL